MSNAEELLERLGKRAPSTIRPVDALRHVISMSFNYKKGRDAILRSSEDVRDALASLSEQDMKDIRDEDIKLLITPQPSWSWYETSLEARILRRKFRR